MTLLPVAEALLGVTIVVLILYDVFQSVVVPRRAPPRARLSSTIIPRLWLVWRGLGVRIGDSNRREQFLGSFGPFAVMLLLVAWVFGLTVGYGMVLDALKDQVKPELDSLWTSIYVAGVSLLTLGFGDFVAVEAPARAATLFAAASGFSLFALVVTLLFTLYGEFERRETAVVMLEAAAGAPPSGVTLLESYAVAGVLDDLPELLREWQKWSADVLDSHLAYPLLGYFRSSHDSDSWVSSRLGAVMDVETLVLTTLADGPKGWAKLSQAVAAHCVEDLTYYYDLPDERVALIDRSEFEVACDRLEQAGFALQRRDEAWAGFERTRATYAGRINAMALYFATPPAQWIGDRSPLIYPRGH